MDLVDTRSHWIPPGTVVLVPVGSTEQHGPHLPFDTDTLIAEAVARGVMGRMPPGRALLAPPLVYGASGEHQDFAGTISIGTEALAAVLLELGRSISTWASVVVFVNGHGGNVDALNAATERLRFEGRDALWVPCMPVHGDAHAGRTETSVLLYLHPSRVVPDRAPVGRVERLDALLPELREKGVRAVSPNGVLGDPSGASAAEGKTLLEQMIAGATRRLGARGEPAAPGSQSS